MIDDKSFRLDGKVALVTGASYGIGFAIASALAEAGATIVFNDISQQSSHFLTNGFSLLDGGPSKMLFNWFCR